MLLFFLQEHAAQTVEKAAEHGEKAAEAAEHAHPWLVEQVYHLLHMDEKSLPPNLIFFVISVLFCTVGLRLFMGKPSVDKPSAGQQMIEVVVLQIKSMIDQSIGAYGHKYLKFLLPLAFFILISNLMGLFPLFEPPTNSFNTTLALGTLSFIYYIGWGFRQQGLHYLKHFTGGMTTGLLALIGGMIFVVEIFSNCLRPFTLGFRLMINMFADEKVAEGFGSMVPLVMPSVLMILAAFVAFVQTFIFIQLSIVYLSETVPHDDHHDDHGHDEAHAH